MYYIYRLVDSVKSTNGTENDDKEAVTFLLVGFSRGGVIFWGINVILLVLMVKRTLIVCGEKSEDNKDLLDGELDGYQQYSPDDDGPYCSRPSRTSFGDHCPWNRGSGHAKFKPEMNELVRIPRVPQLPGKREHPNFYSVIN
ncbi:uncharacterized protein LOC143246155 [Tachypleus tridentatus]